MRTSAETSISLREIRSAKRECLPLDGTWPWMSRATGGGIVRSGSYLIAGEPGSGKSTAAMQLAMSTGAVGVKSVYIATEQSLPDVADRARVISRSLPQTSRRAAMANILPCDTVYDASALNHILTNDILSPRGRYHGAELVVLDSVQGHGVSSASTRHYNAIAAFAKQCKHAGISTVLLNHLSRRNSVTGPRSVEHSVDSVAVLRTLAGQRLFSTLKNRFGPVPPTVPLVMTDKGVLVLSPHSEAAVASGLSYVGGPAGLIEVQAMVSIPPPGSRGRITSTGMPSKELEQLSACLEHAGGLQVSGLDLALNCRVPGENKYRAVAGMCAAIVLVAAFSRRDLPANCLYFGEIDLRGNVRPIPGYVAQGLDDALQVGVAPTDLRIYGPRGISEHLPGRTVQECRTLREAVDETWPASH